MAPLFRGDKYAVSSDDYKLNSGGAGFNSGPGHLLS